MPSASRVNWAKFRVAAVAVVALLILSVLVYLLSGGTLLEQKATISLYIPDATGVAAGAPVRVDGIDVGKVESVRLSGSNDPKRVVKVTITIGRAKLGSMSVDSYTQVSTDNLIGDKFVDITSGRDPRPIQPDGELTYKDETDFMKSLDLAQFEKRLAAVDAVLTDIEGGRSRVGQLVRGDQLYRNLSRRVTELQTSIHEAVSTTTKVGSVLYTDELFQRISQPLREFDRALAGVQSGQGAAGQLLRDTGQYEGLRALASDLRNSLTALRSNEFVATGRQYVDWNRQLVSLIQAVDQANAGPLLLRTDAYDNLNGLAREMRDSVRDFRENPKKFLRLKVF